jgi:hypothetical protein
MSDDNSLDITGLKPVAKVIEAATVKTVDGLGKFFGAICMPAATEFGLLLKDHISAYRQKNLEKIAEKTQRMIKAQGISASGQANPRLIKEILEEASWCEDDTIQSMWAGLLSVASGTTSAADDSLIYTDILKRLTPFQAVFLNQVYWDPRCCSVKSPIGFTQDDAFYPENKIIYSNHDVLKMFPGDLSSIVPIAYRTHDEILGHPEDHSIAISRFRPQIEGLKVLGLIHDVKFLNATKDGVYVFPNLKGLDLFMRGLGYSIYPLEAFLVTLQHWNKKKGVDPFTYNRT